MRPSSGVLTSPHTHDTFASKRAPSACSARSSLRFAHASRRRQRPAAGSYAQHFIRPLTHCSNQLLKAEARGRGVLCAHEAHDRADGGRVRERVEDVRAHVAGGA